MPPSAQLRRKVPARLLLPVVAAILLLVVVVVVSVRALGSGGSPPSGQGRTPSASNGTAGSPSTGRPSGGPSLLLAPLPACRYDSLAAERTSYRDWRITLLDTIYGLPKTYAPPGLTSTAAAGFEGGFLVRKIVIGDLSELRKAAQAAGVPLGIVAAYRSYQQQAALFNERKEELGYAGALAKTARPGHSEHQLGTTLDFKTKGARDVSNKWGFSKTGRWMAANAWRFGFVQSYPNKKGAVTCYPYEPWHFRYVGRTLAALIHDSGLTTREFLWQWNKEHPA